MSGSSSRSLALVAWFAAACGGGATPKPAPPQPAPTAPADAIVRGPLRVARLNGTVLHFRLVGASGTPVVLIHGTLGDLKVWDGQLAAFAQHHRVLVYSRRYHRPNPQVDDAQTYSVKLHAEDLAALLLALDLAPAHLVGASYGAYTALALAREHPELVRSLVLGEPPVLPLLAGSESGDSVRRAFFNNALDPARRAFARGDSVAGVRAFFDGVNGGFGRFDNLPAPARADLLAHASEMRREMLASREQYLPPISCAELGRVMTPVLILKGDRSPRVFQLISDELGRCLRNDTTIVIPGAAHALQSANPAYYNLSVLRYLAAH
jgi:non-heme chloroperoxidase